MQIRVNFNQFPLFSLLRQLKVGGGERDRTDDLLVANQVLSQLSYTPKFDCGFANAKCGFGPRSFRFIPKSEFGMVGLVGIEPTTSRLSGVRSNRD